MKPHKHAEAIKAWADGAEIEILLDGEWVVTDSPMWTDRYEYRIKKHTRQKFCFAHFLGNSVHFVDKDFPARNLRLEFDASTGKLIGAEVIE